MNANSNGAKSFGAAPPLPYPNIVNYGIEIDHSKRIALTSNQVVAHGEFGYWSANSQSITVSGETIAANGLNEVQVTIPACL